MRTTYLQKLHEKALGIIELYNQMGSRLNYAEKDLAKYEKSGSHAWQKFIWVDRADIEKRISHCKAVQSRLESYYKNTLNKINSAQ